MLLPNPKCCYKILNIVTSSNVKQKGTKRNIPGHSRAIRPIPGHSGLFCTKAQVPKGPSAQRPKKAQVPKGPKAQRPKRCERKQKQKRRHKPFISFIIMAYLLTIGSRGRHKALCRPKNYKNGNTVIQI